MKNDQIDNICKTWNAEHALLRTLLENDQTTSKAIDLFIKHHAMVHSGLLSTAGESSYQDEVLKALSEAQMRCQLPGYVNSVVWMLWHITRIEDATMNVLLADSPQVFHQGGWQGRIGCPYADVGNEMTVADIGTLSEAINVHALLAYRVAVGQRTQEIAQNLLLADLKGKPLPERLESLVLDGTIRESARWLLTYWGGHPKTNLLLMPASRHCFVHFNEIRRMSPKLRRHVGE
jgi:DinB superfamily